MALHNVAPKEGLRLIFDHQKSTRTAQIKAKPHWKLHLPLLVALSMTLSLAVIIGSTSISWGDSGKSSGAGAIKAVSAGNLKARKTGSQRYYYFIKSNYHEIEMDDKGALDNMKKASELDPGSYYLKMETARLLALNGDRESALKYALDAIGISPDSPEPRKFAAWLSASSGLWEAAINQYKEILRLHPGNSDALTYLGALYAETGRVEEAETTFKELVAAYPSAISHYHLGSFYSKSGRPQEAIASFNASIKKDPSFTDALTELASLYESQNALKSAERTYLALINAQPELVMPRARLAHLLFKQGRKKEAEKTLSEINIKAQNGPTQFRLGLLFLEQGLFKEAAEAFEGILKNSPKNEKALYLLATTQLELQELNKARDNLAKIPQNGEMYVDGRLLLASITENEDKELRLKESLKIINNAAKAKPEEPRLRLAQAMLIDDLGDTAKARALMIEASKKFPDQAEIFFRLGVFEDKLDNKLATIEAMRKAVELNPRHADALNYLAYTWAERIENLQEALAMAEKADQLKPDSGYIIDTLAWIHYHTGNTQKALVLLERAVPLSGNDPVVLDHLGDVLMKLGRSKDALKTYRQALTSEFINLQPKLQEDLNVKIKQLSE